MFSTRDLDDDVEHFRKPETFTGLEGHARVLQMSQSTSESQIRDPGVGRLIGMIVHIWCWGLGLGSGAGV